MVPDVEQFEIVSIRDCVPIAHGARGFRRLLDVDTEIGFVRVRKTGPNPDIEMNYEVTSYPAFHPQLWLQHWLDITAVTINRLLAEFSEEPPEIEDIGLDPEWLRRAFDVWEMHAKRIIPRRRFPAP